MKLWQLADDEISYGDFAQGWMVVSDNLEDELAGPYKTRAEAAKWIADHSENDPDPDYDDDGNLKPGVDNE